MCDLPTPVGVGAPREFGPHEADLIDLRDRRLEKTRRSAGMKSAQLMESGRASVWRFAMAAPISCFKL